MLTIDDDIVYPGDLLTNDIWILFVVSSAKNSHGLSLAIYTRKDLQSKIDKFNSFKYYHKVLPT